MVKSTEEIKVYFISIPAHKFLHIKNYESDGYFDFWEKQDVIPDMDCDTICGLLDSIKGKLDGEDGFDYSGTDYDPDNSSGRMSYFYFYPEKYEKRILPVKRKQWIKNQSFQIQKI